MINPEKLRQYKGQSLVSKAVTMMEKGWWSPDVVDRCQYVEQAVTDSNTDDLLAAGSTTIYTFRLHMKWH
jgi:hypothetical protein